MSAQTSYSLKQAKAYVGMIFAQAPSDIISRNVEGVLGIEFGVAVSRGTDKEKQAVIGGTDFLGVTIRDLTREGAVNTSAIKYNETETAGIMRDGYVWLTIPSGGNAGALIKYDNTTGIIDAGQAGVGETQLTGAQLDTNTVAGELGVVRIAGVSTVAGSAP